MYTGNAYISQLFTIPTMWKIPIAGCLWIFALIMIKKYAPADTENVPIISKKERRKRKILSYLIVTVMIIVACVVPNEIISNILIVGTLLQTLSITRFAYWITGNKFGYEQYLNGEQNLC